MNEIVNKSINQSMLALAIDTIFKILQNKGKSRNMVAWSRKKKMTFLSLNYLPENTWPIMTSVINQPIY